jgi:hypothetical protein
MAVRSSHRIGRRVDLVAEMERLKGKAAGYAAFEKIRSGA